MLYKNTNLAITSSTSIVLLLQSVYLSSFSFAANSPVKSVDAEGNVTYSDKPVPDAKKVSKVSIHPGPSSDEIDAAKQQAEKNISSAKEIDKKNTAEQKKQKHPSKAPETKKQHDDTVIISGTHKRPHYGTKPRPKPPIDRPGINPPTPQHPIARPGGGGGGQR